MSKKRNLEFNKKTETSSSKRPKLSNPLVMDPFLEYQESFNEDVVFVRQTGKEFSFVERNLITPKKIALLNSENNPACWGIIAQEDLQGPMELGVYLGDKNKISEDEDENEDGLEDNDFNYTFDLGNGTEVNAKRTRGWPAITNSTQSQVTANIFSYKRNGMVIYKIPPHVTIHKGEQLLIFYGVKYKFENAVYLNPSDTDEESLDKLNRNVYMGSTPKPLMHTPTLVLEAELLKQIGMDDYTQYYVPDIEKLDFNTINLPLLAYDPILNHPLPQSKQENLTLLHFASWAGNLTLLKTLLKKGANANQVTRQCGYSPLHFVVLSPSCSVENKIEAIRLLEASGASLKLKDDYGNCILHCVIETKQTGLLQTIIELDATAISECNDESHDCLLLAIATGSIDILNIIGSKMNARLLAKYAEEEDFKVLTNVLERLYENSSKTEFDVIKQKVFSIFEGRHNTHMKLVTWFDKHSLIMEQAKNKQTDESVWNLTSLTKFLLWNTSEQKIDEGNDLSPGCIIS